MQKKSKVLIILLNRFGDTPLMIGFIVTSILKTGRDLACMITLANATNAILERTNVWESIGWMMAAMFIQCPIVAVESWLTTCYGSRFQRDGMEALGKKFPRLPLTWFGSQSTGDVLSTCTNDLDKVMNFAEFSFPTLIRQSIYYMGGIAYCLSQNVTLACITFPVVIFLVPLFNGMTKPIKKLTDQQRKAAANTISQMQEVLADPEFIKSYNLEENIEQRVDKALVLQMVAEQKSSIFQALGQAAGILSGYLPGFIAAAAGIWFLIEGKVTAGFLVSFVQISVQRFSGIIPQFSRIISEYHQASASAERLLEILDAEEERQDGLSTLPVETDAPVFEVKHVVFRYEDDGEAILDGVSMYAAKGETVALVGASGGGKSTLLSLLMGIYTPQEGEVCCMGRPITQWNPAFLREQIAPVFQENFLFPASIRENISGLEENVDKVHKALSRAGLAEVVDSFANSIETEIGERGTSLSGGQRQRMTIARAFYKDTPIVLFDEPTSALDTVTENQFQSVYRELKKNRTTIVVAHRLQTIRDADRIYVLENGKVVQTGCHEELIVQTGVYRRLYESQTELEGVSADG